MTVVIRSSGDPRRTDAFKRAVRSVITQQDVDVTCLIVFNGTACDAQMITWARKQPSTACVIVHGGGKREAMLLGRKLVDTPYFSFLDDDDELLPGALAHRLSLLIANPSLDCVATNGFQCRGNTDQALFPSTRGFTSGQLLESLVESRNWLAAGAAMFRSDSVTLSYFENLPAHREWTVIAFRLATDRNVHFSDVPTCRIHNSPQSESKKDTYAEAAFDAWRQIMLANRRRDLVPQIRDRQTLALRDLCSYYRYQRRFTHAWVAYFRAIARNTGWRFIPYAALLLSRTTRPAADIARGLRLKVDP